MMVAANVPFSGGKWVYTMIALSFFVVLRLR